MSRRPDSGYFASNVILPLVTAFIVRAILMSWWRRKRNGEDLGVAGPDRLGGKRSIEKLSSNR